MARLPVEATPFSSKTWSALCHPSTIECLPTPFLHPPLCFSSPLACTSLDFTGVTASRASGERAKCTLHPGQESIPSSPPIFLPFLRSMAEPHPFLRSRTISIARLAHRNPRLTAMRRSPGLYLSNALFPPAISDYDRFRLPTQQQCHWTAGQ